MHRFFMTVARLMAIAGGIVLSALVGMTVLSILGREANALLHAGFVQAHAQGLADWLIAHGVGPVLGDYELVEAGVAFSIFAFLPLAQITGGHATVDIFTDWLPERTQRILFAIIEIAFAVTLIIIAVQLWDGTLSKYKRHQTTFLLQFPLWWAYAASLVGAVISAVVAVWVALARSWEALTGRRVLPHGMGAEH